MGKNAGKAKVLGIDLDDLVDYLFMVYKKILAGRVDASTVVPLSYLFAIVLLAGLFWFIFWADSRDRMPIVAPEDPGEEEQMKKFLEEQGLSDEDYDYSKLKASKRMNDDDSIVHGSTETYDWSQSKTEMEVFVSNLPSSIRAKEIEVDISSREIAVLVRGEEKMKGRLYAEVIPDECSWQVEDESSSGDRKLWITLYKKVPTLQNKMWPCVIEGDSSKSSASKVKVAPGGTPVTEIDLSDEDSMREAIKQAKQAAAARQKRAVA